MAYIPGVPYNQQQYNATSSRTPDVPMGGSTTVSGAANPQAITGGVNQAPVSMGNMPEWAAKNVAEYNPWAANTVTGNMNQQRAAQNYASLGQQYGGQNPNSWTPWAQTDVAAGGAQGYANMDLLINPTYQANIGKDYMMQQAGSNKGLFGRDIQRNPYTGEMLGYGQYSEIDPTGGKNLGKDFYSQQRAYPAREGQPNYLDLPNYLGPDKEGMKQQLGGMASSYYSKNKNMFESPINTGMGVSQNDLILAMLMNSVPNYQQYGTPNNKDMWQLGPWSSMLEEYGGTLGTDPNRRLAPYTEDIRAKNYNPYAGPVGLAVSQRPGLTGRSYGAM